MDHRSLDDASILSASKHHILNTTGGSISPEMSLAKVIWLYKNSPSWQNIRHLLELPDFLTFKATGCPSRSACSLVCKWGFQINDKTGVWDKQIFIAGGVKPADVDDLLSKCGGLAKDGALDVTFAGFPVGNGLLKSVAESFGIPACEGIKVGGGVIDAYAGALGSLAISKTPIQPNNLFSRMALVSGTSSCHIVMNSKSIPIKGVWGINHL
jgi:ribulose kinase